jgi:hypothetical protein
MQSKKELIYKLRFIATLMWLGTGLCQGTVMGYVVAFASYLYLAALFLENRVSKRDK